MARASGDLFLAVLGGCLLFGEGEGRAEEGPAKLDLVYEAPPECPSRGELEEQLRARLPAGWLSGPDNRRFEIHIMRDGSDYAGRLDVHAGRPDEPSVRAIRAPTCRAVTIAIVVFLALALDAENEPSEPRGPSAIAPPARRRRPKRRPPPPPSNAAATWSSTAGVQLSHLRAPEAAWGARIYGEITRTRGGIGLTGRLSWGFSDFSKVAPRSGPLEFRLRTLRAEGCVRLPIAPSPSLVLSPCVGLDIGTLAGRAPSLAGPRYAAPVWVATAAAVRAGYSPLPWLTIEAELGLLVPFRRTSFELVDPPRTAYTPPAVLFEGGAGVGVTARFY